MPAALPWVLLAIIVPVWGLGSYRLTRGLVRARLAAIRDVQRIGAKVAALEAELRRERSIVERLPDPLVLLGADRAVQRLNAAARAGVGRSLSGVLRHPSFRTALERAQAGGEDQRAELSLPVPIARDLRAAILVLPDAPETFVAVLSDHTRDRAVERMRADFVANASHELRTPLSSLIGFIDTLRGPAADDKPAQTRFLAIMAEQAQRMNRLIDDLLGLSRIEMTEHLPPSDRVALSGVVERIADSFAPQLAARCMRMELALAPALPELQGDEGQIEQVLQNLLDNAIKYGKETGTVRVSVREAPPPRPLPPQRGVAIAVQDDGVGIPADHLPRLTERFYRVDAHRSRAVGGTGLGLAIVKHIVNRHRGQLTIESLEREGTTVRVWLPA